MAFDIKKLLILLLVCLAPLRSYGTGYATSNLEPLPPNKFIIANVAGLDIEKLLAVVLDGADYIEQNLVLSKDGQPVILDKVELGTTTNIAEIYPDRSRQDGKYYVTDFSLNELKGVRLLDPQGKPTAYISSFEEQLRLIKMLEQKLNRKIGIYLKLVQTAFHKDEGLDLCAKVLGTLQSYGYTSSKQNVYLQSYNSEELQRAHDTLMPMLQMTIPLVQLVDTRDALKAETSDTATHNYDWIYTNFGLYSLASYAAAVGIDWHQDASEQEKTRLAKLLDNAEKAGIATHIFLAQQDQEYKNFDILYYQLKIAAIKTKQIKDTLQHIKNRQSGSLSIHELFPYLEASENKKQQSTSNPSTLSILRELQ